MASFFLLKTLFDGLIRGPLAPMRRNAMACALSGDYVGYLHHKTPEEAQFYRDQGYDISDERALEIMNKKDGFYCGHLSPRAYVESFPDRYEIAVVGMREAIRRELGIALPHVDPSRMKIELLGK